MPLDNPFYVYVVFSFLYCSFYLSIPYYFLKNYRNLADESVGGVTGTQGVHIFGAIGEHGTTGAHGGA